jgi:hypothetical protein
VPLAVPAWATNLAPGQFETAALLNTIGSNGSFLTNPPVFQAYQSSAQSIANGALTAMGLNTTAVDTYSGHSNVTNNSRYTPTAPGYYLCLGQIGYAANGTANRLGVFYKNGASVPLGQIGVFTPTSGNNAVTPASTLIQCNGTTDYIELFGYQNSGGALNTVPDQTGFVALFVHA